MRGCVGVLVAMVVAATGLTGCDSRTDGVDVVHLTARSTPASPTPSSTPTTPFVVATPSTPPPLGHPLTFADLDIGAVVPSADLSTAMQVALARESTFRITREGKSKAGELVVVTDVRCKPGAAWKTSTMSAEGPRPLEIHVGGKTYDTADNGKTWQVGTQGGRYGFDECAAPDVRWPAMRVTGHEEANGVSVAVLEPDVPEGAFGAPLASNRVDERLRPAGYGELTGFGGPSMAGLKVTYSRYGVPVSVSKPRVGEG